MSAHLDLVTSCKIHGLPIPKAEYRFLESRKWRLDYAWPEYKLAVEIEGGSWVLGRHNRGYGFLQDMEKYNNLTLLGWYLFRFTPGMVNSGEAIVYLKTWFIGNRRMQP